MHYDQDNFPLNGTETPHHVAVIMDGNGRWGKLHNGDRLVGHRAGTKTVRAIIEAASEIKIKHLTLFAFSSENWQRTRFEVSGLMRLLEQYIRSELAELHQNQVCLRIIGDRTKLSKSLQNLIIQAEQTTSANTGLNLNIALSYGGRDDMVHAAQQLAEAVQKNLLTPKAINKEVFASYLWTAGLPDIDVLIRTGGEQRISNFLLWQLSYAELVFTDILWPDFNKQDFYDLISKGTARERRFGRSISKG